jgi:hypothetical protein
MPAGSRGKRVGALFSTKETCRALYFPIYLASEEGRHC